MLTIVSAVGPDRPGMAHAVAQVLLDQGCNLQDTTMTRLSGQFAMMLAVNAPEGIAPAHLASQLEPLRQSHGLYIDVSAAAPPPAPHEAAPAYLLSLYGPEARGLLARVTGILARHGVNITDVQTRLASAGTVYVMLFELELPPSHDENALRDDLATQAAAIDLEWSLQPLDEDTL